MGKIILASSSPRRTDILKSLELDFEVTPSSYAEPHEKTVFSYEFIENLAYNKALYVAKDLNKEGKKHLVIGADTVVVLDNKILGKPYNKENAIEMLKILSGKTHFVVTSVAIINSENLQYKIKSDTTHVTFNALTDDMIENYVENFKPFDKAGAYGIQEMPDGYIKKIEGNFDNVVGLPSVVVLELMKEFEY